MMASLLEFCARINIDFCPHKGSFEPDLDSGSVRFRSYREGKKLTADDIKSTVYYAAAMFYRYGPGLAVIIVRKTSAKEAISHCVRLARARESMQREMRDE